MTKGPSPLDPGHYRDVAGELHDAVQFGNLLAPRDPRGSEYYYDERGADIVLTWPADLVPARHQIRMSIRSDSAGAYVALYLGDGNIRTGDGIAASWSLYWPTLNDDPDILHVWRILHLDTDQPSDEHVALSLGPDLAEWLPLQPDQLPDSQLPSIVTDITDVLRYWLLNPSSQPAGQAASS